MFSPVDKETYKKIKVLKALVNVNVMAVERFNKWGLKKVKNRTMNIPDVCPIFTVVTENRYMGDFSLGIAKENEHRLSDKILTAWMAIAPVTKEEDVKKVSFGFDIDKIYEMCLPWYNKMCIDRNTKKATQQ